MLEAKAGGLSWRLFFHISMAKDRPGFAIEPHTDSSDNVFTILFYAPETDCNREFGLATCTRNKRFRRKIPFLPNRLIVFVPTNQTWHGVDLLTNDLKGTRNSIQMFFEELTCPGIMIKAAFVCVLNAVNLAKDYLSETA